MRESLYKVNMAQQEQATSAKGKVTRYPSPELELAGGYKKYEIFEILKIFCFDLKIQEVKNVSECKHPKTETSSCL